MMISMNANRNITARPGIAMLAVLMIVMVITVMAVGFLSRSDVELACGENMALRVQMDHLAESGLEHARGLILSPQDIAGAEYWAGAEDQQLVFGSADYYDLVVTRDNTDRCNYTIDCDSYRLSDGERIGRSNLTATLRLDPVIAYWAGSNTTVDEQITINGDVYCNGSLSNDGIINGDVFATGTISGLNISGQETVVAQAPVAWPGLLVGNFGPTYYYGATIYSATEIVDANELTAGPLSPDGTNPAGICYYAGNLTLSEAGGVNITGTLVVTGNLTINGVNNSITAVKNYPALVVGGGVAIEDGASLTINGLAQIGTTVVVDSKADNVNIDIIGGLFIANGGISGIKSSSVFIDITAAPAIASLQTWLPVSTRWSPVGGAFFRSIERPEL